MSRGRSPSEGGGASRRTEQREYDSLGVRPCRRVAMRACVSLDEAAILIAVLLQRTRKTRREQRPPLLGPGTLRRFKWTTLPLFPCVIGDRPIKLGCNGIGFAGGEGLRAH